MKRISIRNIKANVDQLNKLSGFDPQTVQYNTVGAYFIDHCYGGISIEQVVERNGAVRVIIPRGTKREVFNQLVAYVAGWIAGEELR